LPPAEANKRSEKVSGDTPDPPGKGLRPLHPLTYEWMSDQI